MRQIIKINEMVSDAPSSLLIPKINLKRLNLAKRKFGNIRNFFHFIIKTKTPLWAAQARPDTGKILYQEKGNNLRRIDFKPFKGDWEKFRLLAFSRRISMTRLFVFMLLFLIIENRRSLTKPKKIVLLQSLIIGPVFSFIRIRRLIL